MFKKLILCFILFEKLFSDSYVPQNESEKKFLTELRKKELKFGLADSKFYNTKISNDESVNDILKDLLSDYLDLNIKYEVAPFYDLFEKIQENKIMGMSFVNKGYNREKIVDFTKYIFDDELYIVSNKIKISSLDDLEDQNIYYEKGTIYNKFVQTVLENNDLKANLIEVNDISKYLDKLVLTPDPVLYSPSHGVKIGKISEEAIAVTKNYLELIPILNKALDDKYRELINKKIIANNLEISLTNFKNLLNSEEKEYLKNLKQLNVSYENEIDSIISYKSPDNKSYYGIAPNILNLLGKLLHIEIKDVTSTGISPDIWLSSKTKERTLKYLFSNKFYDIDIYLVSLRGTKPKNRVIGVVNNTIEKLVSHEYKTEQNIKIYPNYSSLIEALNKKEVNYILIPTNNFNQTKYNINFFKKIPINFALKEKDIILKNIINKALISLVNKDKIIRESSLERKNIEILNEIKINKQKTTLFIISRTLIVFLLIAAVKIYLDNKHKKQLLKDPLSTLPNRIVFNEFCEEESMDISGYTFVLDIDDFKKLNSKFGHEFGDKVIREFSIFLKNNFEGSYFFRISGDEFYGVFTEKLDLIIQKLKNYREFCPLLKKYDITYSAGLHKKEKQCNIYESFRYSDLALFKAKDKSGFSYKVADEMFIKNKKREWKILELLEGDLEDLYIVCQPKISLLSNKTIGGEVLVRCHSKNLGDVYPNELIPIAENFDFIYKIDYKVAEETIKFIKELINLKIINDNFKISFNLSVKTFARKDLIPTIKNLLKKYDVLGKYIEVEITETILVIDMNDILLKLVSLKELGIQISLDDFTAGHSTAGLLSILPIDIIKFDKSLLDSLENNANKAKIVYQNLSSMIKDLKLKTVSEGIETKEQLDFLKNMHVDYGQGYLISKPLSKEDYLAFTKNRI